MESKRVLCSSGDIACQVQVDVEDGGWAEVSTRQGGCRLRISVRDDMPGGSSGCRTGGGSPRSRKATGISPVRGGTRTHRSARTTRTSSSGSRASST